MGRRWRRVTPTREPLGAAYEPGEAGQGRGGRGAGDRGGEPGVQVQTPWAVQRVGGGAAEGEQGRGGVLQPDGAHFQLLLAPPLGTSVLEPHLNTPEERCVINVSIMESII